jgi:hypothetical protein
MCFEAVGDQRSVRCAKRSVPSDPIVTGPEWPAFETVGRPPGCGPGSSRIDLRARRG